MSKFEVGDIVRLKQYNNFESGPIKFIVSECDEFFYLVGFAGYLDSWYSQEELELDNDING